MINKFLVSTVIASLIAFISLLACVQPTPITGADYQNPALPVEERLEDLLSYMTLEEKLQMMAAPKPIWSLLEGNTVPFATTKIDRLGIPAFYARGGSRGAMPQATAFPVGMARGAAWNRDLEYRVHDAIALEARGLGMNLLFSPVLNIVRHPGMGRAQETYGEDTFHMGEMGIAAITGIQNHMMAQVKHFALNSIEENRFTIDTQVDERTLREIYLPHYRKAVQQAGVVSLMTAYNKVNGQYCSENAHLLQDILKNEWGFDGFVMSDWIAGVHSTVAAANNGLDIEMPIANYFKQSKLKAAIDSDSIALSTIDDINRRILRKKFEWGHFDNPSSVPSTVVKSPAHRALALEAARESMTLLKNANNTLPLSRSEINNIVVLGPSANKVSLGDMGSSQVLDTGEDAVSPLQGILATAQAVQVDYFADLSTVEAQQAAAQANAVIVIASLNEYDEGEGVLQGIFNYSGLGGDRRDLSLHADEVALIQRASASNSQVIVVIQAGSAVTAAEWIGGVEAVLMAWYPGVKGGLAIGETLFGDNNPSGKTPLSWPMSEGQLYEFGSLMPSVVYGFYQGYRYYDKFELSPLFPFGYGLSYTSFSYSNLNSHVSTAGDEPKIITSFEVTNTGTVAGKEVAQLYVGYQNSSVEHAVRDLKGFEKIQLAPAESKTVTIEVPVSELRYWNLETNNWELEDIAYRIEVGASSRDIRLSDVVEL